MRIFLQTVTVFLVVTAGFIALNNIPEIPWSVMQYLWYAWFPCCAASSAFFYGHTAKRSGGSILLAATVFIPILCFSTKYVLPFSSHLTNIPAIIASALLTLPFEICGRNTKRKRKKQDHKNPAISI